MGVATNWFVIAQLFLPRYDHLVLLQLLPVAHVNSKTVNNTLHIYNVSLLDEKCFKCLESCTAGLRICLIIKTAKQRIAIHVDAKDSTHGRVSCLQATNMGSGRFTHEDPPYPNWHDTL